MRYVGSFEVFQLDKYHGGEQDYATIDGFTVTGALQWTGESKAKHCVLRPFQGREPNPGVSSATEHAGTVYEELANEPPQNPLSKFNCFHLGCQLSWRRICDSLRNPSHQWALWCNLLLLKEAHRASANSALQASLQAGCYDVICDNVHCECHVMHDCFACRSVKVSL